MKQREAHGRGESGAAMVEFAIVLPLLLVLVFGIIEFGLLLYNQQVITNASREGARFGIVQAIPRKTESEISTVVGNYCSNHLVTFGGTGDPATTISNTGTSFGDDLRVRVEYTYDFLVIPNLVNLLTVGGQRTLSGLGTLRLRAETQMKYE